MIDTKIFTNEVEESALKQIENMSNLFKDEKIRIMPDVHAGAGSVIGFTMKIESDTPIIPNIVGVDIGCGVTGTNIGEVDIDFKTLDEYIRKNIPYGFSVNQDITKGFARLDKLKCYKEIKKKERVYQSIGSLGGGNHFIEVDEAKNGDKWLIVHSGSRNLGKQIADYYQKLAYETMIDKQKEERQNIINNIPPKERERAIKDMNFEKIDKQTAMLILKKDKDDYLNDMIIAQEFAQLNRREILSKIVEFLHLNYDFELKDYINSTHNYISSDMYIRKGAINASKGKKLFIPINMRDGVIIGIGKGNEDWNYSAPHGAGRLMSRTKAKATIKLEEFINTMSDVYTTSANENTLDEAPMAYKSINSILDNIKDTVDINEILKPVYNFKADNND